MRIGLLTTSFPRFEGDVAGHFVLGFARALAGRGHSVEVLAPEPSEALPPPSWPNITVRFMPYLRPRALQYTFYGAGVPDNLAGDARAWLGLLPFCATLYATARASAAGWDAVVSHFALPCGLIASSLGAPIPHLAVLHSADVHLLARLPGKSAFADAIAGGADHLLLVSAAHQARFLDCLSPRVRAETRARCHVQPMGFEASDKPATEREVLRRELGLSRFTLLTFARLVPVKGLLPAIQVLAHRDDLEWLIAGDGPQRAALEALAARGKFRVRLLGSVTGQRKQALLHAADAFVLPSCVLPSGRSEGLPTALLEAMHSGLPVVASNVGGVSEAVRHLETGLLIDPNHRHALEQSIDCLRTDPTLAQSLALRARIEAAKHEWQVIAPRLEALVAQRAS